ncbi:MAG: transglutaminase domain-containing protein [Clostridiales bacterium]|nr:transglutaminase domain-containing protein [Clostridiales bacterium]
MSKYSEEELEMYGAAKKKFVKGLIPASVLCGVIGLAIGGSVCWWVFTQFSRINDAVRVETGAAIDQNTFFSNDITGAKVLTDLSKIDTSAPGTYQVTLSVLGKRFTSTLEVSDTTPPTGVPIPQTVMAGKAPDVNETVKDLFDLSGTVYVDYSGTPNIAHAGNTLVPVVLTDAYGNTGIVSVPFTVLEDTTPPVIRGAEDITMVAGDPIVLLKNITVTDDYTENPTVDVEMDELDTETAGTYTVTYVSTDESGNTARVPITVTVEVRPDNYVYPETVYARGREVFAEIFGNGTGNYTDIEIAMRIFKWANTNIKYVPKSGDTHWTGAAMQAFDQRRGDCAIFYGACKVLLDIAGIENMRVDGGHIWNLVKLDGQWWHCDACPLRTHKTYWFMRNDNQLDARFPFDGSSLPARATENVQGRLDFTNLTIR